MLRWGIACSAELECVHFKIIEIMGINFFDVYRIWYVFSDYVFELFA